MARILDELDTIEEQKAPSRILDELENNYVEENRKPSRILDELDNSEQQSNVPQANSTNNRILNNIDAEPQKVLTGGVKKNARNYEARFPDRTGNIVVNLGRDVKDVGQGLANIVGNVIYNTPYIGGKNIVRAVKGEYKGLNVPERIGKYLEFGKQDVGEVGEAIKNLPQTLNYIKEGLKETYGQKDIDIINNGKVSVDIPGLAQSFYAHPLNFLDFVGLGEIGKAGAVAKVTKGGQTSKFAKTVGNKSLSPTYSKNLVLNAGERLLETAPVQKIVNAIDNSKLRGLTDVGADFLGLSPESRLLGEKGAAVRQTKLLEQKNQVKNIAERNKAIAENVEALKDVTDLEGKELIKSIESGGGKAYENWAGETKITVSKPKKQIKAEIDKLKFDKGNLNNYMTKNRYKNRYYSRIADTIGYDFEMANRSFNKNVLDDIKNNVDKINGTTDEYLKYVDELEQKVADITKSIPDEAVNEFYNKMYQAIDTVADEQKIIKNNIPYVKPITDEKLLKAKDYLQQKAKQNADFYIERNLLKPETVEQLPINNYASIKYNKPIEQLSDIEKSDALKDIQKLPDDQKPFYVPVMFDDKLRASDFFADSTKRYKPNELKQRKVGMGLEENLRGGKRVYDPVELANRLDAHRIKLVNTENMINEIIDNFAKPYNLKTDKILDGYVPFNPDSFLKFYHGAIDLNEATLRKIEELGNIDTALKEAIQESIRNMPDDVVEYLGVTKNNNIYQIPKEVADTLMSGKNKKGWFESLIDMGTAGFKRKVLGTSPKWFINNRIGNGIMAGLKGVLPQDYIRALNKNLDKYLPDDLKDKSLYEAEKTIIGRTGGGDRGAFGNTMRFLGGEFLDTSELKGANKLKTELINTLALPGKAINAVTDAMFAFNQKFENLERKAVYLKNVDKVGKEMIKNAGQNITKQEELLKYVQDNPAVLEQVMKNVDNTLGDYINMTPVERRVLRKFVPFYSWYRTITRYTLSLPESNPIRASLVNKLMIATSEEDESLPEYQQGAIDTGYSSDITGKPLVMNYSHSIPFQTFEETGDNPIGLLNPLLTQTIEGLQGRRNFMNMPFVSPNYENVFPYGYGSIKEENLGEYTQTLPLNERIWSIPVGLSRTMVPLLELGQRSVLGGLDNLINNGEFKPYDKLYDTSLGGYNYSDVYSRPKGYSNEEQALRYLFPMQEVGKPKKYVKIKRDTKR